ncbi:LXG domain-containing protein [Staphylococcus hyicus]|uniref:LXG domain-containing protein n=1 Tax=Staphylococcus hyicus TaxID=1284 RepID=UPI00211B90D2|nr:LXG domain-containing protein [Staphylococcus hyicus]MCQ9291754.1 LXG domain-containing protein [Staphylococcus hyicus]MCQ9306995.1 LXG domain-containing protein [Staphylococcus hyicus]MCQ9309481.1 LXG domain-containing protein [Staphylococcus hyicus]MCQ9311829.1 LXG domain-containing protein [Staphylococcus hyicus]
MGVKVNMNEVQNMKNAIKSELDKTNGDVDTLKESMASLINTDQFKGATASSVKSYTKTFHYQSINKIKNTNKDYVADMDKSISKFSNQVDNDEAAILHEDKIKTYKDDISKKVKSMKETIEYVNNWIDTVNTLTTAQKVKNEDLTSKATTFKDHVDDTIDKLVNFDAVNSTDGDLTNNLITELKGLTTYVKNDLPANRSSISGTSGKIESAIIRHQTSEELKRWQKFLEKCSDEMNAFPPKTKKGLNALKQAGREMLALKAIGNGDILAGYNKFMSTRNVNELIDNMSPKQLKNMALYMHTDIDNVNLKNLLKSSGEFVKNNPFKKGNLVDWMKNVQNLDSKTSALLKEELKDKNFQYKFGDSKQFFDKAEMKKAASTEFKNTFSSQNFRDNILKKENFKSRTAATKNLKNYVDEGLKTLKGDFTSKNVIGKLKHSMKLGGKVLKPLALVSAITDNLDEKSAKEMIVGMGVDLGAIGASAAAGAAIGTAIPIPVVGTLLGAAAGIGVGYLLDSKLPGMDKSLTDVAKSSINKGLDAGANVVKSGWNNVTSGFKTIFN